MTTIVRIKYVEDPSKGDDIAATEKETLVNINCPIKMVLDYIRKVARLSDTCEFDLCDEINCQLRNVSFYGPNTRATDVFQANSTYFIVTFQRDEIGKIINFTPLLTAKAAEKYCDIMTKTQTSPRKTSSVNSNHKKNDNTSEPNE